ncbi:hypothetical protein [Aliarcobacter cryaerophilus]|uniref:Uncharacterized protein n=1 Tax=Aliarcobacter cryaerophilus TaxID=28198 RepID=A0A2S9SUK5_9BACT|nr:hypothetical protein [Aliarcobacter cryaerophilus]PRM90252.1 hypothetical protein CJ671_03830 [Aliarcobacter cryaerophilus]PRM98981.1 hypothetical protein CJ670_01215 [Arcobacter cryaerophilus gv. crypticus]
MKIVTLILLLLSSFNHLFADSIESVLKIKPPIKYNQSQKYDKIKKYSDNQTDSYGNKYDFGFDIGIDQELMTIDRLKIDVGTKFKGIN